MAFKTTGTRYEGDDPRAPAYSIAEAAHYVRMPEGTLRSYSPAFRAGTIRCACLTIGAGPDHLIGVPKN